MTLNRQMLRVRRIEEAIAAEYPKLEMRCPTHLSIGQEAVAVGVCANLAQSDKTLSGHRAHAHYLAKGGDLNRLIAELHGKPTGCSGGNGGSMHLIDLEAGFMGSTAIVGGTVPIAVGVAWAERLKGSDNVTVVFFGDGCFEEGVVHESMNFASVHNLAIVFVCENNSLAVTTKLRYRQNNCGIISIAKAHGLMTDFGNGQRVEEVYKKAQYATEMARRTHRPQFLEFFTERERVHCGIEQEFDLKSDPVKPGTPEEEATIRKEIEAAFEFARQ